MSTNASCIKEQLLASINRIQDIEVICEESISEDDIIYDITIIEEGENGGKN